MTDQPDPTTPAVIMIDGKIVDGQHRYAAMMALRKTKKGKP